ncbi:ArnT family glycosyltransferase [Robiginitalea sediminis]|uniref:ArnT family glycosyltransferase n=1 Tax=Robiginitalea sediminis TaxID=1982593 RepID=UPI001E4B165A|nr:glycosyltransferase family 39 protein [Robiginitalea sediminis]
MKKVAGRQENQLGALGMLTPGRVLALYTLVSVLLRLPFFFRDYVDRDESTFILMGQAWVDGHLPYTFLWDVKPPLTFLFYTGVIALFGKNMLVLRLIGALVVALTAWFVYKLALKYAPGRQALVAGGLCIYLLSLFGSIQGVMSEHLLMGSLMAGCYFLVRERGMGDYLLAGTLFGVALMIKINIAFALLGTGLWLLVYWWRNNPIPSILGRSLALVLPGILVVGATLLPYLWTDQASLWWDSVILAPLGYTEGKGSSLFALLGFNGLLAAFLIWAFASRRLSWSDPGLAVMALVVLGVVLSFLKAGRVNSHYLIQVYPPLLVLLAALLQAYKPQKWVLRAVLGLALLLPVESYLEYVHIIRYRMARGTWFNGEGYSVPDYLRKAGANTENILFLEYHIGYWVLDRYPPSKAATHPSNLCKDEMFPYYNAPRATAMEELHFLMDSVRPPIVVTRLNRRIFDKSHVEENAYMENVLETQYEIMEVVDQAVVHSRKPGE